jgi:hypothetical protein
VGLPFLPEREHQLIVPRLDQVALGLPDEAMACTVIAQLSFQPNDGTAIIPAQSTQKIPFRGPLATSDPKVLGKPARDGFRLVARLISRDLAATIGKKISRLAWWSQIGPVGSART